MFRYAIFIIFTADTQMNFGMAVIFLFMTYTNMFSCLAFVVYIVARAGMD